MQLQSALGAAGSLAVLGLVFLLSEPADPSSTSGGNPRTPATPTTPPTPPTADGHLILLVEGNANALRISEIFAKPSGYQKTKVQSPYQIVIYDGDRREIGRYPMDLSAFDLNPDNVGKPLTTSGGDQVVERNVTALINVPNFKEAASLVLEHKRLAIGELSPRDFATMRKDK